MTLDRLLRAIVRDEVRAALADLATHAQPSKPEWVPLRATGLPRTTARRAIARGEIAASKIGRALYVRRLDVDRWIASRARTAPSDDAYAAGLARGRARRGAA